MIPKYFFNDHMVVGYASTIAINTYQRSIPTMTCNLQQSYCSYKSKER